MKESTLPLLSARPRFKPYPAYKVAGVEWLGAIPAHWEVKRLKTLASVQLSNVDKKSLEGQESVRLCNYVDVYYNERITGKLEFMAATATREQVRRFSLLVGDVLVTKDSESWTDIAVPAVVAESLPGVLCGYHLAHIRPDEECDGAFLGRAFASVGPRDQLQVAANGITRFGLGGDAIRTALFPVPPLVEQRAITAFLDRETTRIDALVAKKERLIELLREKRTALITRAVTKGLDPNAPVKDSGVEWLGQTPAHWEVRRIAMVAIKITNGYVGPTRDILVNDGTRYLQSLHIKEGSIDFERRPYFVTPQWSYEHLKSVLDEGDVLVVQTGDIGQVAVVRKEFAGCNCHALIIIRLKRDVGIGEWLAQALQSDYGQGSLTWSQTGALHPHLECGHVREIRVAFPPLSEQVIILQRLKNARGRVDSMVTKIREAIERLKELRTALISAAVTGKIDVREEVP